MLKITKLTDTKTVAAEDLRKGMKIEYANKIREIIKIIPRSFGPILVTFDESGNRMEIYPTNNMLMKVVDSAKDAINTEVEDVDLDFLIKDEIEAIDGYRKMIAKTSNPKLLSVLSHILDEETEHIEELREAKARVYKVEGDNSIKDSIKDLESGALSRQEAEEVIRIIKEHFQQYAKNTYRDNANIESWRDGYWVTTNFDSKGMNKWLKPFGYISNGSVITKYKVR